MNMDEILTLVQAVSDSKLTSFKLDQGDMHISLKKEKEEAKIITVNAPGAVAAVPASTAQKQNLSLALHHVFYQDYTITNLP